MLKIVRNIYVDVKMSLKFKIVVDIWKSIADTQ